MNLSDREKFRQTILDFLSKRDSEVWAFHPQLENIVVSNTGKVKNYLTGKILKQRKNAGKYNVCSIRINKKTKSFIVSRLVAQTFLDYCGNEFEVNHVDGDKDNNHLSNLNWLTRNENLQHAKDIGIFKRKCGSSYIKYSKELIKELIEFKNLGDTYKELSASYKIPASYICILIKKEIA